MLPVKFKFIIIFISLFAFGFVGASSSSSAKSLSTKTTSTKTTIGRSFVFTNRGFKRWFKVQVFGRVSGKKFIIKRFRYWQESKAGDNSNIKFYRRGTKGKQKKNFIAETPDSLEIGMSLGWSHRDWEGGSFPAGKRVCATFVPDEFLFDDELYWSCFKVPS